MMIGDLWVPTLAMLWMYTVPNLLCSVLGIVVLVEAGMADRWMLAFRVLGAAFVITCLGSFLATVMLMGKVGLSADEVMWRLSFPMLLSRWCVAAILAWGVAFLAFRRGGRIP